MPAPMRARGGRASTHAALVGIFVGVLLTGLVLPFAVGTRGGMVATGLDATEPLASVTPQEDEPAVTAPAGGPVEAEGAPAGDATGSGPAGPPPPGSAVGAATVAAGPPADTSPVKLGFTLFDIGGASRVGFAIAVDPEEQRQAYQAYVDHLNATGGINGRKIQAAYSTYDLINQDSQTASCLALTQDAKVFAVIGGYVYGAANQCVVEQNQTLLVNNNSFSAEDLYRTGRHVSIYARSTRMMDVFARRLAASGQLRGKAVGILDDAGADPNRGVLDALVAAVEANGGTVARAAMLSSEPATASSQIPVEVHQMRTAGVEVVLMITNPLFGTQFVQQAEGQRWTPTYGATDWYAWYSNTAVQNMPASFEGAFSVTSVRTSEDKVGIPEPPQAVRCREIFRQVTGTQPGRRGEDRYGSALQACDVLLLFAAAARGAGPELSQASFVRAVQGLGPVESAAWGGGAFAPGKLDLNDNYRINRFSTGCRCWKPTTTFSAS